MFTNQEPIAGIALGPEGRVIFMEIGAARAMAGDGFNGVADVDNFLYGIPPVWLWLDGHTLTWCRQLGCGNIDADNFLYGIPPVLQYKKTSVILPNIYVDQ